MKSILVTSFILLATTLVPSCVPKEEKPAEAPKAAAEPPPAPLAEPARSAFTPKPGATYTLEGASAKKCLQSVGGVPGAAKTEVRACTGAPAQQFRLQPVAGGYFTIVNVAGNKCLDVNEAGMNDGAPVLQYDCHGGSNQHFIIADATGGNYRLVARHSGRVLDVSGDSQLDGALVGQWQWKSSANQIWKLSQVGGEGVATPAGKPGAAADVKDAKGKKAKEAKPAKEAGKPAPAAAKP